MGGSHAQTLIVTAQLKDLDVLGYPTWLPERAPAYREGVRLYTDLTPVANKEAPESVAG